MNLTIATRMMILLTNIPEEINVEIKEKSTSKKLEKLETLQNKKPIIVELSNTKKRIMIEDEEYEFDDCNTNDNNEDASECTTNDNNNDDASEFSVLNEMKIERNKGTENKKEKQRTAQNRKALVVELSNTKGRIMEEDEEYEFDDYLTNDNNDDASECNTNNNNNNDASEFSVLNDMKIEINEGT